MKDKLLEAAKALYAIPTVYRLTWTTLQLGAGVAAGLAFDDPVIAIAVTIIATALSSVAREHLAKKATA